jgi:hypothetical protein
VWPLHTKAYSWVSRASLGGRCLMAVDDDDDDDDDDVIVDAGREL